VASGLGGGADGVVGAGAASASAVSASATVYEAYEEPPFVDEEWASSAEYGRKAAESFGQAVASAANSTFNSSSAAVATGASGSGTINATTGAQAGTASRKADAAAWVVDNTVTACMLCGGEFGLFHRRHHCRRCGRMVCAVCAPFDNSRPIPEWGLMKPERHCVLCYKSPVVNWKT
jgi:hypothetical protein